MAQLTWRNVDAPNLAGSLEGIRTFGTLLNQSGKGLSEALGAFQTADQQSVSNQIMQRALGYSDAANYQQALADGTIIGNVDASRIDPKVLEKIGDRTNELTKNAQTNLSMKKSAYDLNRQVDGDARLQAADPAIRAIQTAARTGDQRAMNAALQNPLLLGLRTDQIQEIFKNAQSSEGTALSNQGSVLSNTQSAYGFGKQLENDNAQKEAQDYMVNARLGSVSDRQYQELLGQGIDSLSPAARRLVANQLGLGQSTGGVKGAGSAVPSAPGTAGTRNGNDYDVMYQYKASPQPLTTMTMGETTQYQRDMIKSQGNSPVGRYQINKATIETFAPQVFGKNWQSVQMTPENQDKLGEAIFNARKNGNLQQTWVTLPDATPGAYKNAKWSDLKNTIAWAEGTTNKSNAARPQAEVRGEADIASRKIQNRVSQEAVNSLSADFDRAVTDNRGAGEVMNEALAKGGKFAGADRQWLAQQIELGQEYGKSLGVNVSPAMALTALSRSTGSGRTSAIGRAVDAATSWIGGGPRDNDPLAGYGINADKYKSLIRDEYAAGKSEERVAAANYRNGLASSIQEARKAADAAAAELMQARAAAQNNPRIAAGLPRLEQRLVDAQARQASLTMKLQESNSALAAQRRVRDAPKKTGTVNQRASGGRAVALTPNPFIGTVTADDLNWNN